MAKPVNFFGIHNTLQHPYRIFGTILLISAILLFLFVCATQEDLASTIPTLFALILIGFLGAFLKGDLP